MTEIVALATKYGVQLELQGKVASHSKFDLTDLTESVFAGELHAFANEYVSEFTGNFAFLKDIRQKLLDSLNGRCLDEVSPMDLTSIAQAKGILNCVIHDYSAAMINAEVAASDEPERIPVTEPGIYEKDGEIFKVQKSRGSDRVYAKRLVIINADRLTENDQLANWKFEYASGAIFKLSASDRMSLEDAKNFSIRSSHCACCGRALVAAASVERGIGPVCMKWFIF